MPKDDKGIVGTITDLLGAAANEVDIFSGVHGGNKSGPSVSGTGGSRSHDGFGGWDGNSAGSVETGSDGVTRTKDNSGRVVRETVRHGDTLYHHSMAPLGLGRGPVVGTSKMWGDRLEHYDADGRHTGTSHKRGGGVVETYDNSGNLRFTSTLKQDMPFDQCPASELARVSGSGGFSSGGGSYSTAYSQSSTTPMAVRVVIWGLLAFVAGIFIWSIWPDR